MRYVFLIYGDEPDAVRGPDLGALPAIGEGGRVLAGHALHPGHTATTVRRSGGRVVIADGPVAPDDDQLNGVCIAELRDLDDALRAAKALLGRDAGSVEIRPVRTAG